jgi:hypothetical protein
MKTPSEIRAVSINTVPHDMQRYDTVGDYVFDKLGDSTGVVDRLRMTVSDMGDWRFGIACGVHELVEAALLVQHRIDEAQVSEFDTDYEAARREWLKLCSGDYPSTSMKRAMEAVVNHYRGKWACPCEIDNGTEPGEDIHAPYYGEHMVADNIERIVLRELGGVWKDYQDKVESMVWHGKGADPFKENGESSEDADG